MVRLVVLLSLLAIILVPGAQAQEFEIPSMTVAGGELPQPVRLAPADADAFRRRLNQLPRLEERPEAQGAYYTLTSGYWALAVRLEDDETPDDVAESADFYPQGGFVRVAVGGEDTWSVLNLRQREILARYIHLGESGRIGASPSTLSVLSADAGTDGRFGFSVGPDTLEYERGVALLSALASQNPEPFLEPRVRVDAGQEGFWLTITLPEGRSLRYFYDGATLTEALGTERYVAGVSESLGTLAPAAIPAIRHQDPAGSFLWWPVMVGGGIAAIGLAVLLRRRQPST